MDFRRFGLGLTIFLFGIIAVNALSDTAFVTIPTPEFFLNRETTSLFKRAGTTGTLPSKISLLDFRNHNDSFPALVPSDVTGFTNFLFLNDTIEANVTVSDLSFFVKQPWLNVTNGTLYFERNPESQGQVDVIVAWYFDNLLTKFEVTLRFCQLTRPAINGTVEKKVVCYQHEDQVNSFDRILVPPRDQVEFQPGDWWQDSQYLDCQCDLYEREGYMTGARLRLNGEVCVSNADCDTGHCDSSSNPSYPVCAPAGGCFTLDTPIFMADGVTQKRADEIVLGDYVIGTDGNPAKILYRHVRPLGKNKFVSINGSPHFATVDHPFVIPGVNQFMVASPEFTSQQYGLPVSFYKRMQVGSAIYKWNTGTKQFDNVTINAMTTQSADIDTPIIVFEALSPDGSTVYTGNGYLTGFPGRLLGYTVIGHYIVLDVANKIKNQLEINYATFAADANNAGVTFNQYVARVGVATAGLQKDLFRATYSPRPTRKSTFTSSWVSYVENSGVLTNDDLEVVATALINDLTFLQYTSVASASLWLQETFLSTLSPALDTIAV